MLLEVLISLEVIAFIFLALGIIPFKRGENNYTLPLANKIIFILVAFIIFAMLSLQSNQYDYNYCYVNETLSLYEQNKTTSVATCESYQVTNQGLSYLNMGMAVTSIVIMIIISLVAAITRKELVSNEE